MAVDSDGLRSRHPREAARRTLAVAVHWPAVLRAEHGESVPAVAHRDHVADIVPSGGLDRALG
jgi:hypothetical protein